MKKIFFISLIFIFIFSFGLFCFGEENTVTDVSSYFETSVLLYNQNDDRDDNDNIEIHFDEKSATLTIGGSGRITEFFPRIWDDGSETYLTNKTIKKIIIESGIIGMDNSFNDCIGLETVIFPDTFQELSRSFVGCDSLQTVVFSKEILTLDSCSFYQCKSLSQFSCNNKIYALNTFFNTFAPKNWEDHREGFAPTEAPDSFMEPIDVATPNTIIKKDHILFYIISPVLLIGLAILLFFLIRNRKK